mmetsp:Transcript_89171/g.238053  ORF Transcript_89171/g.238053 Transcript_89171/m.238053 type:complete len:1095 (+) Transcript_89171:694-3978(+)
MLTEHVKRLKEAYDGMDKPKESNSNLAKFQVVDMSSGVIEDFHKGFQHRIGSCPLKFFEAMKAEHCNRPGHDKKFVVTNYRIFTCPKREWELVVEGSDFTEDEKRGHRQIPEVDELLKLPQAVEANLTREEVISIVLYTGPMFQVYNTILRRFPEEDYEFFNRGGNLFPTTIFVLVSSIQKLSRVQFLPEGLSLYRGLGGNVKFSQSFFECDKHGIRGFTEWGFMSTTSVKEVAIEYSGVKKGSAHPLILQIRIGGVDRGACIQDFSQYPLEKEYLWVPCSFVQQEGTAYLEMSPSGVVKIFPVRVNSNLKTMTVEELVGMKKSMHLTTFKYLIEEVDVSLRERADKLQAFLRLASDPSSDKHITVPIFLDCIVRQCRDVLSRHEALGPESYANDELYRTLVLEMEDVKFMAMSKLEEWIENKKGSFISFRMNAQLRTVQRRWILFLSQKMETLPKGNQDKKKIALQLCKVMGLIAESVSEKNELGETRLMAASAEGRSSKQISILVEAGAHVNETRPDGVTPLWLAAQFGHERTLKVLSDLNADVNLAARDGATPMYIAAQNGNVNCISVLFELKGNVDQADLAGMTPLHQAAMNGQAQCIMALLDLKADASKLDGQSRSAQALAAEHNHVDCVALLESKTGDLGDSFGSMSQRPRAEIQKKLIISTGDISDVDGFMALAHYAQSGADCLFIMNYPAYMDVMESEEDESHESKNPGLGFKYGARKVLSRDLGSESAKYKAFLDAYGPAEGKENHVFRSAMTDLAFTMAKGVWEEASSGGRLFFCIGGTNKINPFSAAAIKNEILVYSECFDKPESSLPCVQGTFFDASGQEVPQVYWDDYSEMYFDFNGSAAFWDETWLNALSHPSVVGKIRGAFVMGGVYSDAAPITMPSIPGTLNRFSSATMNQLYHPQRSAEYLAFFAQKGVPIYLVSNNVVQDIAAARGGEPDYLEAFLASNGLRRPFLERIARVHYNSVYKPPKKPFDFYVAYALCRQLAGPPPTPPPGRERFLYLGSGSGISLVSARGSWEAAREEYAGCIDVWPAAGDGDFARNKKANFRRELAAMRGLEALPGYAVRDLQLALDADLRLSLLPPA